MIRSRAGSRAKLHKEELLRETAIKKQLGVADKDVTVETVDNARGLIKRIVKSISYIVLDVLVLALAFIGAIAFIYLKDTLINVYYGNLGIMAIIGLAVLAVYMLYAIRLILRERKRRLRRAVVSENKNEGVIKIEKNTAVVRFTDILGIGISLIVMAPICVLAYLGIISLIWLTPNLLVILSDSINQIISAL